MGSLAKCVVQQQANPILMGREEKLACILGTLSINRMVAQTTHQIFGHYAQFAMKVQRM
jgi:hypothetical protein